MALLDVLDRQQWVRSGIHRIDRARVIEIVRNGNRFALGRAEEERVMQLGDEKVRVTDHVLKNAHERPMKRLQIGTRRAPGFQ